MTEKIAHRLAGAWRRNPIIVTVVLFCSACALVVGGMLSGYLMGRCVVVAWIALFGGDEEIGLIKVVALFGTAAGIVAAICLITGTLCEIVYYSERHNG